MTPDTARDRARGPGRPRDPEVDAAVLRAAVDVLVESGVDRAGIERIAKRAGVTKVTVYRRWRTKEDLLAHAIESVRADLPTVIGGDESVSTLPVSIERLIPRWATMLADPRFRALSARLLAAGTDHPALLEAYRTHHVQPRRERAREFMRRAQDEGRLDPAADVDMVIDMMEGAIVYRLLLWPGPLDPEETARYLRALLAQAGFALSAPD